MSVTRSLLNLNPWLYLLAAGIAEMGFTTFMKLSNGFQHWTFNICFAICALTSFGLLNLATRSLSLGTAYAVWTGLGAFGTATVGILLFADPATFWRLVFLTTLILSIIGLKFVS
jgi:quaternary ammonium compound-resistance protein SugE